MINITNALRAFVANLQRVPVGANSRAMWPASSLLVPPRSEPLPEPDARPSVALAHCGPACSSVARPLPHHQLAAQCSAPSTARAAALPRLRRPGASQPSPARSGTTGASSSTMARRRPGKAHQSRAEPPPGSRVPLRWRTRLQGALTAVGGAA
jgi:hypothetical protein